MLLYYRGDGSMKRYIKATNIFGMSKSKSDLAAWIEDRTFPTMCALAQLYVFPNNENKNHWRQEVWGSFNRIHVFRHNNKLPSAEFIYKSSWGVDSGFVESAIDWAIDKEAKFTPRDDINIQELTDIMNSYFIWISEMLSKDIFISTNKVYKELDELGL